MPPSSHSNHHNGWLFITSAPGILVRLLFLWPLGGSVQVGVEDFLSPAAPPWFIINFVTPLVGKQSPL